MTGNKEIIYVAFGYEYLCMAAFSAQSAKEHNRDVAVAVVTNINFDNQKLGNNSPFDRVILVDKESVLNRQIKTNVIEYTSAQFCVYVDCDTEVRGSFEPMFKCLEVFDMAMKINVRPTPKIYEIAPGIPYKLFPAWNAGVIFFQNNNRVRRFFKRWSEFYREEGKTHDQPTLARAIYENPDLKLLTLNNIWNTFPEDVKLLRGNSLRDSRVWHYREPNYWPQVAPLILKMHKLIFPVLVEPDVSLQQDIAVVEQRYRFLSTALYRLCVKHPLLIKAFKYYVKFLAKIGLAKKVKLKREIQLAGVDYEANRKK